jgi:hypothetical protein
MTGFVSASNVEKREWKINDATESDSCGLLL